MKSKKEAIVQFITNRGYRVSKLSKFGFYNNQPDDKFLKKIFKIKIGKNLDLENPKTFNEKLQWIKLYDRKPIYTTMVDKYEVKKYVADIIGEEYIIPTIGVWDRFEDIDFDSLPEQFVLKCTHDSNGLVICKDKKTLNCRRVKSKIKRCLKRNHYFTYREWPYKDVKPRIIAEKYMEDTATADLRDYKFFCFDGEAKMLFIATDRQKKREDVKLDFFDMEFNHLPITKGHSNAAVIPRKPKCFDEMRALAEKLSENIPHVRVDFYEVDGKVYFSEFTFFSGAGLGAFSPEKWDEIIGSWIKLPEKQ